MREQRRKGAVKSSSIQLSRRRHGSVYIYKVKKEELVLVIPVHVDLGITNSRNPMKSSERRRSSRIFPGRSADPFRDDVTMTRAALASYRHVKLLFASFLPWAP